MSPAAMGLGLVLLLAAGQLVVEGQQLTVYSAASVHGVMAMGG